MEVQYEEKNELRKVRWEGGTARSREGRRGGSEGEVVEVTRG